MKKRIALTTILLLLAAVLSAASIISAPAATVNLIHNTAITTDELDKEAARYEAMGVQGISKLDILQSLINNEVLMQGAERDGIVISDRQLDSLYATAKANVEAQAGMAISDADFEAEVINQFGSVDEYKEMLRMQVVAQQYLMQEKGAELQNVPTPDESAIQSFYRQNQQGFFQPENVKLAHIYIPKTEDAEKNAEAKALLEKAAAEISSGAITFEKAVSEYSEDTGSNSRGGDIGWLTADNAVARQGWGDSFCNTVLSMEPGEVSGVLESNTGYHIVKVSVHNDAKILSINDPVSPEDTATVHDYIANLLYMQNQQEVMNRALQSLVSELRSEAQINILYKG